MFKLRAGHLALALLYCILRYVADVHGTRDPGLIEHRKLLAQYCEKGTTRLMEWDGEHRVPIRTKDVLALVRHIRDIASETGLNRSPIQKHRLYKSTRKVNRTTNI
jgi:hypothetical protein